MQICPGGNPRAAAADQSASLRVCGTIRVGNTAGKPQREGLDQDLGDVFGSRAGRLYVPAQAQIECLCRVSPSFLMMMMLMIIIIITIFVQMSLLEQTFKFASATSGGGCLRAFP